MADDKGLYLLVTPSGGKLWRLKFRVNGKEKKLSLGAFPDVSLKEAWRLRDLARAAKVGAANGFEVLAEEYIDKMVKDGI